LGQFIVAVTDWMVRPVRRLVPGLFGLDTASLLLAWLWQVVYQGIALGLSGVLLAVSPAPTLVGVHGHQWNAHWKPMPASVQ
jgi:YggT family protein